jgi:hypothetical protein
VVLVLFKIESLVFMLPSVWKENYDNVVLKHSIALILVFNLYATFCMEREL